MSDMKRYILGAVMTVILACSSSQSSPANIEKLPDLAIQGVVKTRAETFREPRHSWKILVKAETSMQNETIVIEVLEGTAVDPSLRSSGTVDFTSLKSIVDDVTSPRMTDEQKALSLWRFTMDNIYNGPWGTSLDGLEHLTVYGYGYCGTFAAVLEPLWWAAGLKARHVNTGNHAGTEVYYDNEWHYMDAHQRFFSLNRDNQTIASLENLNNDPDLWDMKRHEQSSRRGGKKYYYMSMHPLGHGRSPVYTRDFTMAKGDVLTLYWQKSGKWCLARGAEGGGGPAPEPEIYANGTFKFHRNLADTGQCRTGLVSSKNIDWQDLSGGYLHPLKSGEEASLIYYVRVPYFIPQADISGTFLRRHRGDTVGIDISTDNGTNWTTLWGAEETGQVRADVSTNQTQEVTTDRGWKYSYLIRIRMLAEKSPRDVGGYALQSTAHLFYNPRSLPALRPGENTMVFHDDGNSPRVVRVTYIWQEDIPIHVSNEEPLEGEEVMLSARIVNLGDVTARRVPVVFHHGSMKSRGTEIGRAFIETIAPGKTAVANVRWKARRDPPPHDDENSEGATIYVMIDPENAVQESNKKNNTFVRLLNVLNPPDVTIPSPSFIKLEKKRERNDIITITATVRNFSNSRNYGHYLTDHAEARGVRVRFFDGEPGRGRQIGPDKIIASLLPLEFKNVSVDWDISQLKGQHRISVQLFSPKNVIEAGWKKEPDEISTFVDLDAYWLCSGAR